MGTRVLKKTHWVDDVIILIRYRAEWQHSTHYIVCMHLNNMKLHVFHNSICSLQSMTIHILNDNSLCKASILSQWIHLKRPFLSSCCCVWHIRNLRACIWNQRILIRVCSCSIVNYHMYDGTISKLTNYPYTSLKQEESSDWLYMDEEP